MRLKFCLENQVDHDLKSIDPETIIEIFEGVENRQLG